MSWGARDAPLEVDELWSCVICLDIMRKIDGRPSRVKAAGVVGWAVSPVSEGEEPMEFESVIRGRRSIRAYTSEPVPAGARARDPRRGPLGAVVAQHAGVERLGGDRRRARAVQDRVQGRARPRGGRRLRPGGDGDRRLAAGVLGARGRADEDPRGDARSGRRSLRPGRLDGAHGRLLRRPRPARVRVRGLPRRRPTRATTPPRSSRTCASPPTTRASAPASPPRWSATRACCATCCPAPRRSAWWSPSTLGYPDLDAPANTFERSRADLDELVTWVRA